MIFKLLLVSDEADNFQREISIDADSTFLELNNAILKACNYSDDQITSFYICNDEWEQEAQIIREEMDSISTEDDVYIMGDTPLRDLLNDVNDKLVFVFDPLSERMFFIKVSEVITGKNLKEPKCTKSVGKAPAQIIDYEESMKGLNLDNASVLDEDQDFYGSDGYNDDEFDPEAFEIEDN